MRRPTSRRSQSPQIWFSIGSAPKECGRARTVKYVPRAGALASEPVVMSSSSSSSEPGDGAVRVMGGPGKDLQDSRR